MSRHAHAAHPRAAHHPHEKPHHPHWPLAALLFAFVLALGLLSVHETATWLHLSTGRWILAHKGIPGVDPFSYTVFGRPWTTDSWLADSLFYLIDRVAGPAGVIALKSAVAGAGFALLLPLNPASPLIAAGVLSVGALAGWAGFTERPFVFDLLMLALMIRALRPRRHFHWTMVFHVAGIELLWANLHGPTAVFGVWLIVLKVLKAAMRTEKRERLNYLGLLAVAGLALLCNPHGVSVVGHIFTRLESSVTAWQPLSAAFNLENAFLLVAAAACTVTLQQEFVLTMTAASLVCLGLLLPDLRTFCVLGCCPTVALALGHYIPALEDTPERAAKCAAALAAALGLHWAVVTSPLGAARGYPRNTMAAALHFLEANGVRGRMFNEPAAGAMIIAGSERPVFVDERRALYGTEFLRDAESWPSTFPQLAGVYGFDYAVLLNRRASYPARILDEDAGWAMLYADDDALVYARKSGADGALASKAGKSLFAPNQLLPEAVEPALARPGERARALAELDAWIAQAPGAVSPLLWKAFALDRLGSRAEADELLALAQSRPRLAGDPELMAALGFVLERRGDEAAARRSYDHARGFARRRGEAALVALIERRLAAMSSSAL